MRIREEYKKSGYFWLPSDVEKKIPGTLSISDGGVIELEIVGLFNESKAFENNENLIRIVGHIEKDGLVTLENCFYKIKNVVYGGISKSLIHVNKVFSGVAYEEGEEISFNTMSFSIEGIDEWVGISGIKVDRQSENYTATINFQPPEEIHFNLNNGMQLLIAYSWTLPGFPNTTEAKITQKTYFKLTSGEKRNLIDFTLAAHKITTLLCFAIDKIVCLEDVCATSDDIQEDLGNGKSYSVLIKIYYQSTPFSKEEPKIDRHAMLFRFGQIRENAEKIINSWFNAYDEIDPALNLYFSAKTGAQKYLTGQFLALAQGLEIYHRRTSNEKLMDEKDFKKLLVQIICQCQKEKRKWLRDRLIYGNEINLGNRIKKVIEPFKEHVGSSDERSKIIRSIVDTRNYLTHYDKSLKPKAASGKDLWSLCLKMEAFFQLHFLQVLGFTQQEIKSVLDNCHQLKRKLINEKKT